MIMPILSVKNLQASIDFYAKKLAFKHDFTMPGPDGIDNFAIVWLHDGVHFGLGIDPENAGKGQGVGLMVYVAPGESVDVYYERVQQNGVEITTPIKTEYWGDRTFSVTDPDGYSIVFCQTVKQMTDEEIKATGNQPS
jgi:uncharacterized glyoxalase superfamily protein PhnB